MRPSGRFVDASVFDAMPCPWVLLDGAGRIVEANLALARLLGAPRDAVVGSLLEAWLNMPSRVMLQSVVQPLLKLHGAVAELALSVQPATGAPAVDVLCYSQRGAPGEGPDAGITVSMQLVPITRRRRIEAELLRVKHAADQGSAMIFQLEQMTAGVAAAWRFPYVSEAARRLYGASPEAVARSADPVFNRVHPEDRAALLSELARSAQAGNAARMLMRVLALGHDGPWRAPGRGDTLSALGAGVEAGAATGPGAPAEHTQAWCWHELHAVPRQRSDGVTLWHGQIADVTERVAMQEAVVQRQALERVARARSEFIGRVSHELRTPLNGILGFAQLMASDVLTPLAEAHAARLGVILQSGRHLLGVVNDLLQISRIEAGQLDLPMQPVRAETALARVCTEMQALADARGIVLHRQADPAACVASAEPQRLHQVLLNLVSNAIKYNRRDGSVTLGVVMDHGRICIRISDTGPGLSVEQQAALFQPFNRLGAERGSEEGTGLGLVLSRHLVELMDGQLRVDSAVGVGSTFSVSLPAATAGEGPGLAVSVSAAAAPPVTAPLAHARHGRVLYVEDNPVNAVLMEAILLQRPGVGLVVCDDGAAACRSVLQAPPSLLLLDMHLPDGSGLALLPRLRALPGMQAVPAIVVSASAGSEVEAAALAAGFDGYWTKPLDVANTLAELDRWLDGAA